MKERIVAEISKNWPDSHVLPTLSSLFEHVIETNAERGYALESWQYVSTCTEPGKLSETIVAVFKLIGMPINGPH